MLPLVAKKTTKQVQLTFLRAALNIPICAVRITYLKSPNFSLSLSY